MEVQQKINELNESLLKSSDYPDIVKSAIKNQIKELENELKNLLKSEETESKIDGEEPSESESTTSESDIEWNNSIISINTSETRIFPKYSDSDKKKISLQKKEVLSQLEQLDHDGYSIWKEQIECANQLYNNIVDRPIIFQMVIGLCQSGKTALIRAFIKILYEHSFLIFKQNIVIITGLSSNDWKKQMNDRMPSSIKVFHRQDLKTKLTSYMKNKTNVLIIIDEIQVASKTCQTVYESFKTLGYLDGDSLMRKNIYFVEISATPNGLFNDLMKWDNKHVSIFKLKPGANYTGLRKYRDNGKLFQYKDLCGWVKGTTDINGDGKEGYYKDHKQILDNIHEIKNKINEIYQNNLKYHVIRTPVGILSDKTIENFKSIFPDTDYNYKLLDSAHERTIQIAGETEKRSMNINDYMKQYPNKHTFIFIKETCRCSITYNHKQYLGVSYERSVKSPDDSVMTQGAVGRICGYNVPEGPICFTNLESIDRYIQWWQNNFPENLLQIRTKKNTRLDKNNFNSSNSKQEVNGNIPVKVKIIEDIYNIIKIGGQINKKIRSKLIDYIKCNLGTIDDRNEEPDKFNCEEYNIRWRRTKKNRWKKVEKSFEERKKYDATSCLGSVNAYTNKDCIIFIHPDQIENYYIYIWWPKKGNN